jgi:hypothetical protein
LSKPVVPASKLSQKTTAGSLSMPASPGYVEAMPLLPSGRGVRPGRLSCAAAPTAAVIAVNSATAEERAMTPMIRSPLQK